MQRGFKLQTIQLILVKLETTHRPVSHVLPTMPVNIQPNELPNLSTVQVIDILNV